MIIRFSFGNVLSFKEPACLSMVATSLKEPKVENNPVTAVGDTGIGLLSSAAVFGANASGKSNIIKAFRFFKDFTVNSFGNAKAGRSAGIENFRLNSESIAEPSSFELIFLCNENRYRYGFEVFNSSVSMEWLYCKSIRKRSKEIELFFRDADGTRVHGSYDRMQEIVRKQYVRSDTLCLSLAAWLNDPTATKIMRWMSDTAILSCSDEKSMWDDAMSHFDDNEIRQRIISFSKSADLGIESIKKMDNHLVSTHIQYDTDGKTAKEIIFPFTENESEGTIKYFGLAYPIIHALDTGGRLIIDELDSKLHPLLVSGIVGLFSSAGTNPHHAQLIFTTHDTALLGAKLFRRDQVWFTEKDIYSASSLYSLSEYKVRSGAAFERDYLSGRYGATPILGDLTEVFTARENHGQN